MDTIFTQTEKNNTRKGNEKLLQQRAVAIWLTGLSGSGKTTLARELSSKLQKEGFVVRILDGDDVRTGLNAGLGFTEEDRMENIRRVAEVAKLFIGSGIVTICCFISPSKRMRELAKSIIGEGDFLEVYLNCPLEICEKRDIKGLYARARAGKISEFTGITSIYEPPRHADIEIMTGNEKVTESCNLLYQKIIERIQQH